LYLETRIIISRTERSNWRRTSVSKTSLIDLVLRIATKLKRQINQLKKDKLVHSIGGSAKFEDELDKVIEENFVLQEEERRLMEGVKKLQKKKQKNLEGMSSKVKVLS